MLENRQLEDDGNGNMVASSNAIYEEIDDYLRDPNKVISSPTSHKRLNNLTESNLAGVTTFKDVSRSDDVYWEFPREALIIEKQLGKGNHSSVSKASVIPTHAMDTIKTRVVAVKTLQGLR